MNDPLGHTYRDSLTGFEGICTGYVQYVTGCNQMLLQPKAAEDKKLPHSEWIDEQRCERLDVARVHLDNGESPGFDRAAPKRL